MITAWNTERWCTFYTQVGSWSEEPGAFFLQSVEMIFHDNPYVGTGSFRSGSHWYQLRWWNNYHSESCFFPQLCFIQHSPLQGIIWHFVMFDAMTQWSENVDFTCEFGTGFDPLSNKRQAMRTNYIGVGLLNFRTFQYSPTRCIIFGLNFTKMGYVKYD